MYIGNVLDMTIFYKYCKNGYVSVLYNTSENNMLQKIEII